MEVNLLENEFFFQRPADDVGLLVAVGEGYHN